MFFDICFSPHGSWHSKAFLLPMFYIVSHYCCLFPEMFPSVGSSRVVRVFSLPFLKLFWSADGLIRDHCEMRSSVTGSGLLVNNISRSSISGSIFYSNYKFFVNFLLERTSVVTIF